MFIEDSKLINEIRSSLSKITNEGENWTAADELVYFPKEDASELIKYADGRIIKGVHFIELTMGKTHQQDCDDAMFIANAPEYVRKLLKIIEDHDVLS